MAPCFRLSLHAVTPLELLGPKCPWRARQRWTRRNPLMRATSHPPVRSPPPALQVLSIHLLHLWDLNLQDMESSPLDRYAIIYKCVCIFTTAFLLATAALCGRLAASGSRIHPDLIYPFHWQLCLVLCAQSAAVSSDKPKASLGGAELI